MSMLNLFNSPLPYPHTVKMSCSP
uniref:Uncharacterized protein n=1 Tax=Anguilla anguilla TaxID=7936 RepID=A0A0E9RGI2_ANGAN